MTMNHLKSTIVTLAVMVLLPLSAMAQDEVGTADDATAAPVAEPAPEEPAPQPVPPPEESSDLQIRHQHQIMAGIGLPLVLVAAADGFGASGFIYGNGLFWMNIPISYHRRFNDVVAVGGGLMVHILGGFGIVGVGGSLMGSARFYFLRDFLWIEMGLMLGYPILFGIAPAIGHNIPITEKVQIVIKNEFVMFFPGMFVGFWEPVIAVDIRF
jgi:hypothetical protein